MSDAETQGNEAAGAVPSEIADALLSAAKAAGADYADAVVFSGETLSVEARAGALEAATREEFLDFGLRVLIGGQGGALSASVSASDPSPSVIAALAERAVAMARESVPDPYAALAAETMTPEAARASADALDLRDLAPAPSADALLADALAMEASALEVSGVSQVEGASASWRLSRTHLATSGGFSAGYEATNASLGVSAVAGRPDEPGGMERDYDYSATRGRASLRDPGEIGRSAAERAVARRFPKGAKTGAFPVIFDKRIASSIVSALLSAANGASIARGSSFLMEKMGERVLPDGMALIDDPLWSGGLGARPFDGEGVAGRRKSVIDDGRLALWLLDTASAAQLGLASNGSATRGVSGAPRPGSSTAWLSPGARPRDALIGEVSEGLLVTEMMGGGVNGVTGDYSRGASGFWIENGQITHPVSELTVAGNFLEMLAELEAADDLVFDRRIVAPTVRVARATVASNG